MTTPSTPPESTRAALDPERVAELVVLAKAATPGPWIVDGEREPDDLYHIDCERGGKGAWMVGAADKRADAAFIAAASPDFILSLLTEYTRLQADAARLDWLDARREEIIEERTVGRQVGDDEWEPELQRTLVGHHWAGIDGQCDDIRFAIDADMQHEATRAATPVEVPSNG